MTIPVIEHQPGLCDTHIHGYAGVDVMDNNIEGTLHTMSEGLLLVPVLASFLPQL